MRHTPPPQARRLAVSEEGHLKAAKVAQAWRRTPRDRLTGTAKGRESDKLLSDASRPGRRHGQPEARQEPQRPTVAEAPSARRRECWPTAQTPVRGASCVRLRRRADALQADAERKHSEIMGTINQQRTVLGRAGWKQTAATFERELPHPAQGPIWKSQSRSSARRRFGRTRSIPAAKQTTGGGFNQFKSGQPTSRIRSKTPRVGPIADQLAACCLPSLGLAALVTRVVTSIGGDRLGCVMQHTSAVIGVALLLLIVDGALRGNAPRREPSETPARGGRGGRTAEPEAGPRTIPKRPQSRMTTRERRRSREATVVEPRDQVAGRGPQQPLIAVAAKLIERLAVVHPPLAWASKLARHLVVRKPGGSPEVSNHLNRRPRKSGWHRGAHHVVGASSARLSAPADGWSPPAPRQRPGPDWRRAHTRAHRGKAMPGTGGGSRRPDGGSTMLPGRRPPAHARPR